MQALDPWFEMQRRSAALFVHGLMTMLEGGADLLRCRFDSIDQGVLGDAHDLHSLTSTMDIRDVFSELPDWMTRHQQRAQAVGEAYGQLLISWHRQATELLGETLAASYGPWTHADRMSGKARGTKEGEPVSGRESEEGESSRLRRHAA